ncbi:kinesin-like protein KIF26A isoform X1 [Pleurodeles waltl]|uniref:kinesin-like protein KIF26A isoform X1 n=1 Tax=Pleurodeles waltl TaxID=8319 RepID=UPI0037096CD1
MAFQEPSGDSTSPTSKPPSLLDIGALCLDSEIIFGFTSHLLRRKGRVAERSPSSREVPSAEPPGALRIRLQPPSEEQEEPCGSRPPPEGAGAAALLELGEGAAGRWCGSCRLTLSELQRQALRLAGPGPHLDPRFTALIFDKLQVPDHLQKHRNEGETRCDTCATHLNQLKQEAVQMIQSLNQVSCRELNDPVAANVCPRLAPQSMVTVPSPRDLALLAGQVGRPSGKTTNHFSATERTRGFGWTQGAGGFPNNNVQVTVGPSSLSGALSSVTIQAQQYLEGMWSISRVNSFLPPSCLTEAPTTDGGRGCQHIQTTSGQNHSCEPVAGSSLNNQSLVGPDGVSAGTSAAASFFIRAAQKLNLSSKRKKYHPPLPCSHEFSGFATNFSGILQVCPPPAPPCLLRAVSKTKDNPGIGKVKVMVRICPTLGAHDTSESMSYLKVDARKKQVTLYDPSTNGNSGAGHRRATVAVPKMFAFDSVFPQDASQAEVCSGTVAEVIQSVVNGADGCIFCYGHVKLGKTYTMMGKDSSTQGLGVVPCAISWLFKLINERKEKAGTRFSIRVSAVEICGKEESLKDLLSEVATGSMQDGQSPGVYLREDPICGTQLQNQSELRAPTAEKAAFFLDAAIAARSTSRPDCDEEERRNSHMLFTLHVYQYRMEKNGKGGMSGGRSRLHLIDLGSCEKVLSKNRDGGGALCLSLSALGNVILALVNGAKHVPYKDSKLTMLLRESLGNINCRTTMIAHISDSPANYAETLTTVQLASRIHRMRKKKSKYASSSSGGESSCEEGRARRPPHLRPFHPRTIALDPDFPALSLSSDPDYSSSSEQSCDTVIYVGPNGAALSDRELTDNEGPPEFVPIIPSLNRKRSKDNFAGIRNFDQDHFKCNTFAELQERLECIDGSEEPATFSCEDSSARSNCSKFTESTELAQSKLAEKPLPGVHTQTTLQDTVLTSKGHNIHASENSPQNGICYVTSTSPSKMEQTKSERNAVALIADIDREIISDESTTNNCSPRTQEITKSSPEPVVKEKNTYMRRPLPSPAPPPPQKNDYAVNPRGYSDLCSSGTRTPPVGMSKQMANHSVHNPLGSSKSYQPGAIEVHSFHSALRGKRFERDILTTTVTLQQPVELNGEDELVFTVVEELSIGGMLDNGRPTSIISFNSDCSLQALASGSRPVSIISSINDEFDAYTSQMASSTGVNIGIVVPLAEDPYATSSRRSSISSWLSEVSICTIESDETQLCEKFTPHDSQKHLSTVDESLNLDSTIVTIAQACALKSSLNDSGFCFSEMDNDSIGSGQVSPNTNSNPRNSEPTKATPGKQVSSVSNSPNNAKSTNYRNAPRRESIHSSLPRKTKSTSSASHNNPMLHCNELQMQEHTFDDPWLMRTDVHFDAKSEERLLLLHSSASGKCNEQKQPAKVAQHFSGPPKAAKSQTMLACSQRVVDGCEVASKSSLKKSDPPTKMPQLRRGATTLGVMPVTHSRSQTEASNKESQEATFSTGSLKHCTGKKVLPQKTSMIPRPSGITPPAPPVRKSSLEQKQIALLGHSEGKVDGLEAARPGMSKSEEEVHLHARTGTCSNEGAACKMYPKGEQSFPKATSSLKTKMSKSEAAHHSSHVSLERCDSLTSVGSKASVNRENGTSSVNNRQGRSVPRLGVPPVAYSGTSPPTHIPPCPNKASQGKSINNQKAGVNANKNRGLSTNGSKNLSSSVKSLNQVAAKNAGIPPSGKTAARSVQCVNGKPGRGTIMGTKQAIRAANSRVNELVAGSSGKKVHFRGSTDSDSGNDSGINLCDEMSPTPVLPSPYSKITAPRRPQRYSSGHGSDNSSVLSGELPPAMGRTALFYHSGGSSGYESMIRDSEATGSASSAHDSMSESGMSSSGRMRTLKSPKKRSTGLQRRRLVPAPLPETASLGRKPSTTGQWVDLPPLPGTLKEPFEIKVYEIDDVERLQRHRQEEAEPFQDVEKGLTYFNNKLKILERRQQRIRDMKAKYELLKVELEETKSRLMIHPDKWKGEFDVDPDLDMESQEYLDALEQATEDLDECVNLCKARIMMVTCFDIGMICDVQDGAREVEV